MLMFGLNDTMYHFAMANSVHWNGYMLRREEGNSSGV